MVGEIIASEGGDAGGIFCAIAVAAGVDCSTVADAAATWLEQAAIDGLSFLSAFGRPGCLVVGLVTAGATLPGMKRRRLSPFQNRFQTLTCQEVTSETMRGHR